MATWTLVSRQHCRMHLLLSTTRTCRIYTLSYFELQVKWDLSSSYLTEEPTSLLLPVEELKSGLS